MIHVPHNKLYIQHSHRYNFEQKSKSLRKELDEILGMNYDYPLDHRIGAEDTDHSVSAGNTDHSVGPEDTDHSDGITLGPQDRGKPPLPKKSRSVIIL